MPEIFRYLNLGMKKQGINKLVSDGLLVILTFLLSLCEQTSNLSIEYNLISTCTGACD
jgi:hypothetical protein